MEIFFSILVVVGDVGGGGIGLLKFHLRANNLNLINLGQYVSPRVRARKFVVLFRLNIKI